MSKANKDIESQSKMRKIKRIEDCLMYHQLHLSRNVNIMWKEIFKSCGLRGIAISFVQNIRNDSQAMRNLRKEQYQATGIK